MTDVRKIHVVYICNFVSSIDWKIRLVKNSVLISCWQRLNAQEQCTTDNIVNVLGNRRDEMLVVHLVKT